MLIRTLFKIKGINISIVFDFFKALHNAGLCFFTLYDEIATFIHLHEALGANVAEFSGYTVSPINA
jgi:hypothetical protein